MNELKDKDKSDQQDLDKYLFHLSEDFGEFSAFRVRDSFVEKVGWLVFSKSSDQSHTFEAVSAFYTTYPADSPHLVNINNLIVTGVSRFLKQKFSERDSTQIKNENLLKLLCNLTAAFKQDSSDIYKVINRLLFLKTVFKNLSKFAPCDDWLSPLMDNSVDYMDSVVLDKVLLRHLVPSYSVIYLMNKYLRCISCLWLDEASGVNLDYVVRREVSLTTCLTFLLDEFERIEGLNDQTLTFRTLMMIMKLLVNLKDDYSAFEDNFKKIHNAFNTKTEPSCFKLSLIYDPQQDDDLIVDFNLLCLNILLKRMHLNVKFLSQLFDAELNVHRLFINMLDKFVSFKYETIIDWLISNETNFLLYFLRYVKFLCNDLELCGLDNLNRALGQLNTGKPLLSQIELKTVTQFLTEILGKLKKLKKSFPYNCEPLIKALERALSKL
jgi:hypothetical protein